MEFIDNLEKFINLTRNIRYRIIQNRKYGGEGLKFAIKDIDEIAKILPTLKKQLLIQHKMSESDIGSVDFSEIDKLLGIKEE